MLVQLGLFVCVFLGVDRVLWDSQNGTVLTALYEDLIRHES